jgi:hypothetical protein
MNPQTQSFISALEFGKIQVHENMAVFPVFSPADGSPEYMSLKEALAGGKLVITEVSEGGQVPNLKVSNKADIPVLLLDGEELAGAKQNRVLNTTILVKPNTELVIPVSCTEHGRWSYASRKFSDSGVMMAAKMRAMKAVDLNMNLDSRREFSSDQGAVWDGIAEMSQKLNVVSRTGAMNDAFEQKKADLSRYIKAFVCDPRQKGMVVFIGGRAIGLDFLSRESVFGSLFPKLVKSYAMEALIAVLENTVKPASGEPDAEKARSFLAEAAYCEEKSYDSVGMGVDFRYTGKEIVGSALCVDVAIVHMVFFRAEESEIAGRMAGVGRRRGFRTN